MRHLVLGLVMALLLAGSAISAGPSANAFITNSGVTDVSVLDTATNGLRAESIGASTHGVAMDPKGTRVYAADGTGAPRREFDIERQINGGSGTDDYAGAAWFAVGVACGPNKSLAPVKHRVK